VSDSPPDLTRHQPALLLWATYQLPPHARGKLDPADLVQQTLLEVLATPDKLAGRPDHEVLAYLRRALANNVIDAARKFAHARDGFSPDLAGQSSVSLADWLAADDTSPSERAARNEKFETLASALLDLPTDQRVAVELRYLQGMKVKDIAVVLARSEGAVSLLLFRAVKSLRDVLPATEA
jgi:RNA polymerase sigma-70 factor, ECF subfamily